ncbi:MAG: TonB-dependent receptor plug domain-containing protein [Bacteroidales bacterium]
MATYYEEGGISPVSLKETVVTARKQERLSRSEHSRFVDGRVFVDESPINSTQTLGYLIGQLPGVQYRNGSVYVRGLLGALFILDNITLPSSTIDLTLPATLFESVEVAKGAKAAFWGGERWKWSHYHYVKQRKRYASSR